MLGHNAKSAIKATHHSVEYITHDTKLNLTISFRLGQALRLLVSMAGNNFEPEIFLIKGREGAHKMACLTCQECHSVSLIITCVCVCITVQTEYLMGTWDLCPQTNEQHKKESTLLTDQSLPLGTRPSTLRA